jgi:SRSO17 transposase
MQKIRYLFKVNTREVSAQSLKYISGLFCTENNKRNISKMTEKEKGAEYYQLQHFISNSPWDHKPVQQSVIQDVHSLFEKRKLVGFYVDESGFVKKGDHSVGVSHQYCGNVGKQCNSQCAVFGCLVSNNQGCLVDSRLFLSEDWIKDKSRCSKAGIPEGTVHKKKTALALEMVRDARKNGIRFDYVGGDGLYGHDSDFLDGLETDNELYVLDIHSDTKVFTSKPNLKVPEKVGTKGRTPTEIKPDIKSIQVAEYCKTLSQKDWQSILVRETTKGAKKVDAYCKEIWVWKKGEAEPKRRLLIIIKENKKGKETKIRYVFSNAKLEEYNLETLVYMQSQRFFIEHSFRESKQDIGMSDYQIRSWMAWHHHIVMCMLAHCFILKEKILHENEIPILSANDIRRVLMFNLSKPETFDDIFDQMEKRHKARGHRGFGNTS